MPKYLVLRFSSIGDILLTTPVVRCLAMQQPGSEIHYLTRTSYASLLEPLPYIHRVISFEQHTGEILRTLKQEHYDFVIDLHKNFRSVFLRARLGRPSASFPKLNFRKWWLVHTGMNLLPSVHVTDRYFEAVRPLGITNDGKGLDLVIPEAEEVSEEAYPEAFRNGFVAMAVGARHFTKQIPAGLAAGILRNSTMPFVLLGGKEDHPKAEEIISQVHQPVWNACGQLSLLQSASVLRRALAVVTADTGLMHMAAALGKKTLSIWGSTTPAFGMYPYLPGREHLSVMTGVETLACRPCSKLGHSRCPRGHFKCMNEIDAGEVASLLMKLLSKD